MKQLKSKWVVTYPTKKEMEAGRQWTRNIMILDIVNRLNEIKDTRQSQYDRLATKIREMLR